MVCSSRGTQASHIGIQKSENCSAMTTVTENITKARRALYSRMDTGLHGEDGIDPETAMSMIRAFISPILTYVKYYCLLISFNKSM
jgi:hypothetical protein